MIRLPAAVQDWFTLRRSIALGVARRDVVLRSLRVTERRIDEGLGEVLSNEGLVAVFGRSTDRKTLRLVRWADGDVRRPWQKRRDSEARTAAPSGDRHESPTAH